MITVMIMIIVMKMIMIMIMIMKCSEIERSEEKRSGRVSYL